MLRVLINACACSPNMGSELGLAWKWCVNLAKYCVLAIITEGEFRDKIETIVSTLPQGKNMHFHYNPVSNKVRRMCWNQGDWRFYWYYRRWQQKTYTIAKEICKDTHIDILHQFNMIGFREPGYLWRLSKETAIPFVWGPVDAKDKFPVAYLQGASIKHKCFIRLKNAITILQLKHSHRVKTAANQASAVLAASDNSIRSMRKYLHVEPILINETGCNLEGGKKHEWHNKTILDLLWVEKMDFRKQLSIAIRAVAECNINNLRLHIVGGGDNSAYKDLANSIDVDRHVWHGAVSHDKVQEMMLSSDLLFFTSVAEGTPHVVLESIANGLPVLCFDTCGHGYVVNNSMGFKIPLTNPKQSVKDFAAHIRQLYDDRSMLVRLSEGCKALTPKLSWDSKAKKMVEIYYGTQPHH